MLQKRDEVMVVYLRLLKARLAESIGVSDVKKDLLNKRLDDEIAWFTGHKEKIPSAGDLKDLIGDSDKAKTEYKLIEPLFYEVLLNVSFGKLVSFHERLRNVFDNLKTQVEDIRNDARGGFASPEKKFQTIDRWFFDSESKMIRGEERQTTIETKIDESKNLTGDYSPTLTMIGEAQLFYKESASFLKEVIREIKITE